MRSLKTSSSSTSVASWVYRVAIRPRPQDDGLGAALVDAIPRRLAGGWNLDLAHRTAINDHRAPPAPTAQMGGDREIRANVVPGISPNVSNPSALEWFNPAAFALQTTPYGTVGTRHHLGPGSAAMGPRVRARNSRSPNSATSSSAASCSMRSITSITSRRCQRVGSAGFGTITAARPGRNIQLGSEVLLVDRHAQKAVRRLISHRALARSVPRRLGRARPHRGQSCGGGRNSRRMGPRF